MNQKMIKVTNLIFLIILGILLIIPMRKIDNSTSGKSYLKDVPSIDNKEDNKFNQRIGQDFDAWLGSRFFTKYELMKLNKLFSCVININYCIEENKIFDKKNNSIYTYTFFGSTKNIKDYDNELITQNIQKLNDWCKERKIKLYFLIIPRRADFIKHNVPDRYYRTSEDKGVELIKYVKEHTDANIIFPYEEMIKANKISPVYFKTDHHWTQTGAYAGYKALMKEIKKDFPDIFVLGENQLKITKNKLVKGLLFENFDSGSMLRNSGVPDFYVKKILKDDYFYYTISLNSGLKTVNQSNLPNFNSETDYVYTYSGNNKKRVVLIGDSFTSNLSLFLPYSFKEVVALLDNNRKFHFSEYEQLIDEYKPDIIIINMRTSWVGIFKNFSE